jgi:hypothetical protein
MDTQLKPGFYKCTRPNCDGLYYWDSQDVKYHGGKDNCWGDLSFSQFELLFCESFFKFEKPSGTTRQQKQGFGDVAKSDRHPNVTK